MHRESGSNRGVMPIVVTSLLIASVLGILLVLWTRRFTETESILLGVLLTAASTLVSWLITDYYGQQNIDEMIKKVKSEHKESIQRYAEQAAEKVLNLSNELERVSDYLRESAEETEAAARPAVEIVLLMRERFVAAAHAVEMLQSMNDTFLSDWNGVIGREIKEQKRLEAEIEDLRETLQQQQEERQALMEGYAKAADIQELGKKIQATEDALKQKQEALPFRLGVQTKGKHLVDVVCQNCSGIISVRTRAQKSTRQLVGCSSCGSLFELAYRNNVGQLRPVPMINFKENCTNCKHPVKGTIPDFNSATSRIECSECHSALLFSKTPDGIRQKVEKTKSALSEVAKSQIEATVLERLAKRPWPPGIHKEFATELGVSNSSVGAAIDRLLKTGQLPAENPDSGLSEPRSDI